MKRGRGGNVLKADPAGTRQEALRLLRDTIAKPLYDQIKLMELPAILEYVAAILQLRE